MALKNDFRVTTAGYSPVSTEDHIDLSELQRIEERTINFHLNYPSPVRKLISLMINIFVLKTYSNAKYFETKYWTNLRKAILQKLSDRKFDVVIVHGIDALPIGVKLCKHTGTKLVFNAHEYYPREFEEDNEWVKNWQPFYNYICSTYLNSVNLFINVAENIRKEYLKNFGVDSIVITNAADYRELPVNLCGQKIKVVHHGAALRSRNIDLMIKCALLLDDRFTFDLMLVPTDKVYYAELQAGLKNNHKINLIDPVDFNSISKILNGYDIGLYILPINNFNNEMALPNKFFEFIQARLMLAISPNPEMATIIKKYNLGIIAPDFTSNSLAIALNKLTVSQINEFKSNSQIAATKMNSEVNSALLLKKIKELV